MRGIFDGAAVDKNEIGSIRSIDDAVAVVHKLANHELAVGNVVGAPKSFDVDGMGTGYFFIELEIELDLGVVDFFLLDFGHEFLFDFLLFVLAFEDSFAGWFEFDFVLGLEVEEIGG